MTARQTSRIVYLDGVYLPVEEARVPIFDRGLNFGDGIYEVTAFINRRMVDFEPHLARLRTSLDEIGIEVGLSDADWIDVHRRLIAANAHENGTVYIQVTRGAMERDFVPHDRLHPTIFGFVQPKPLATDARLKKGVSAVLVEDLRWKRRDIKSTSLLAQVLAKSRAHALGAAEAILYQDGMVTEGSSTSVFGVDSSGILWTHPLGTTILPGITRRRVIALAEARGFVIREEAISTSALFEMEEIFLTGATHFVVPVVEIERKTLKNGKPGPVTLSLQRAYIDYALTVD